MSDADRPDPEEQFKAVYKHLRAIAGSYFRGRPADQTLQPTALVHEAFLRLVRRDGDAFESKTHFVAVASRAMRQILTDAARRRTAAKRGGGGRERVTLSALPGDDARAVIDVLALDGSLTRLAEVAPRQARVVELRFFGGLTVPECATVLEVSVATVEKEWRRARAWLHKELAAPR